MTTDAVLAGAARAVKSLAPAVSNLERADAVRSVVRAAVARGHFTPEETARLRAWFAAYLTVRGGLLEVIEDLRPRAAHPEVRDLPCFVVAYAAACLLVRTGRFLVRDLAVEPIVQRKLNEASAAHRFPRKQYTAVYRSLTRPAHAWRLAEAMRFAAARRADIVALRDDPALGALLGPVVDVLDDAEPALRVRLRSYLGARARYRWHAWRRRRATACQRALFRIAEAFGRVIADVRDPRHRARLAGDERAALAALLRPGDVLVTRHDRTLSNLFLPGYWPHAALHVGPPDDAVETDLLRAARWCDPLRVLEARKDGVLLRPLDDTLAVDACAVLRPTLAAADVVRALANALRHEGKLYNFDFDFFTDDRLVCTEVVYRAYEGVGDITFTLSERAGRPTLSAEDLITMALEGRGFQPVAVYGLPATGPHLLEGEAARQALSRPD